MQAKACKQCGQEKPLTREFWHIHKKCKGGFNPQCKACVSEQRDSVRRETTQEDGSILRKCRKCGDEKPLVSDYWHKHYSGVGGFRWVCKICVNERGLGYYHENQERYSKNNQLSCRKRRLLVLAHYSSGTLQCACCGEAGLEFLALDHRGGGGNKHRTALGLEAGDKFMRWLVSNGYPEGYRVLCHNCNCAHGYYGYCPHESPELASSLRKVHK